MEGKGCVFLCLIGLIFLFIVICNNSNQNHSNGSEIAVPHNTDYKRQQYNRDSYQKQLDDIQNQQRMLRLLEQHKDLPTISNGNRSTSPDDAYDEGYNTGYEQGMYDGKHGYNHGYGYDDSSSYYDYYETQYQEGYESGYDDGYYSGKSEYEEEDGEREEDGEEEFEW